MSIWFDKLFGDFYQNRIGYGQGDYDTRPFFIVALTEDEEQIRKNVIDRYRAYYARNQERLELMRMNLLTYAGLEYFPSAVRTAASAGLNPQLVSKSPKVTSNIVQRLVNERVTTEMLYPADIAVVPLTDDFEARIDAEAVKDHMDFLDTTVRAQRNREMVFRLKNICGESYRWIFWNADAGRLDPAYKRQKDAKGAVTLDGPDGEKVRIVRAIYEGEVDEQITYPWDIGLEAKTRAQATEWAFVRYWRPTDELHVDYPDKRADIIATEKAYEFSMESYEASYLRDHTLVIEFFHRSTPYLPDGYWVKTTPDCILDHGPNPYSDLQTSEFGNIPVERLTDLDLEGSLHGWSQLQGIAQLGNQFDNALTRIGMNIFLGAVPKWLMPKGACQVTRLANKATVVQYSGPVAPQLVTFSTVPKEVFDYKDAIKTEMQEGYGSSSISRGEPPTGVTANAALQFLDLQQQEARALLQLKADLHLVDTYNKRLAVCAQFYDENDERFTIAMGQDKQWYSKVFNIETLKRNVSIQLMVSNDLPKRKDALMATVMQLSQIYPQLFPPEAILDMFKIGGAEKFLSAGRAAWQAAEYENYCMARGDEVFEPAEYEELVVHWRSHAKDMQSPQFRRRPTERQTVAIDHLLATELLMLRKARSNIGYAQQLQQLAAWPLVLPLPPNFGVQPGPQMLEQPGAAEPGGESGGPAEASNPNLNQQRFTDGQFGRGVQPVMSEGLQ